MNGLLEEYQNCLLYTPDAPSSGLV